MYPKAKVPERLFTDEASENRWRDRFTTAKMTRPVWAKDAPSRNLYLSNISGVWEVFAWDRDTNIHRQVTNRRNGTLEALLSPDGEQIWWFADTDGDEFGHWVTEPFFGLNKEKQLQPAIIGVPDAYEAGIALGHHVHVVGCSSDDGVSIWLSRDDKPAELIYQHKNIANVSALSKDEKYLVVEHSEHGDVRCRALKVLNTEDATTLVNKWDGPGKALAAVAFSPVFNDQRVLVKHERRGKRELLLWDVISNSETELAIDLPGEITGSWYPDGTALLISHNYEARISLYYYDIATGKLDTLNTSKGNVRSAGVRPDGTVEYAWSCSTTSPVIRAIRPNGADQVLLTPPGATTTPESQPLEDIFLDGPGGQIHVLMARPHEAPEGPLPTVFLIHGGPHRADEDCFSPYRAAWLEAGFAVIHVNYRGSTGYGSNWKNAIIGCPGLTELEDIATAHDWAITSGLASPERCIIAGRSWGGYLTLLALGTQPKRWAAGVASIPVADYVTAYADETEELRAYDRAWFGGSPDEIPEIYQMCSPLTYVDQVEAPVLILAGENDPVCPIRQIENYLDRLSERGADFAFYRYDAGHGSLVIEEVIRQTATEITFALEKTTPSA